MEKQPCKDECVTELKSSGGSDPYPLPVCKKCGWITFKSL